MPTLIEERMTELSGLLKEAANEYDMARTCYEVAASRWDDAQHNLTVAKNELNLYLSTMENDEPPIKRQA